MREVTGSRGSGSAALAQNVLRLDTKANDSNSSRGSGVRNAAAQSVVVAAAGCALAGAPYRVGAQPRVPPGVLAEASWEVNDSRSPGADLLA